MIPSYFLIVGDDFSWIANEWCVEIENDINEENDIHYGVHNQKSYVTWSCKTGTVNSQIKWHHDHCVEGKA